MKYQDDPELNQGRGFSPPSPGFLDTLFALALGFCAYQLLMLWMES